jgi:hypothetical protein
MDSKTTTLVASRQPAQLPNMFRFATGGKTWDTVVETLNCREEHRIVQYWERNIDFR